MLRTRTDLWGAAFISTLGLSAFACSSSEEASDKDVAASNGNEAEDDANDDDAQQDDDTAAAGDDDTAETPGNGPPDVQTPATPQQPGPVAVPASGSASPGPAPGPIVGTGGAAQGPTGSAGFPVVGPAGGSSGGPVTLPAGGSGPGPTTPVSQCANSKPLLHGTVESGLETCANGVVHRPAAVQCPNNLEGRTQPTGFVAPTLADGGVPAGGCQVDADCTAEPFGHCDPLGQAAVMTCVYGCTEDADCAAGQICICGPDIGQCQAATCATDDDCEGDAMCAEWYDRFGVGCGESPQYACQTANDTCASSQDCTDLQFGNCAVVDGARTCVETPGVACGRPFLVHGQAVLADAVLGPALPAHLEPAGPALTSDERAELCSNWTEIGLMEHASIAAFARFCLQLMQLGAPSELLAAAQAAMVDETVHAQLAFELASRYAGREISAGPLPLNHVSMNDSAEEVLRLVIREGCLGETVAALEAVEARAHCAVTDVSMVLERIANDEQNHAALAWRFVSWAVAQSALRDVARSEFDRIAREAQIAAPSPPAANAVDLRAHGALPQSLRAEVRIAALRDVVLPCAKRLLDVPTTSDVTALHA